MKRILLLLFIVFFSIENVFANEYQDKIYKDEKIPNMYIRKINADGQEYTKQGTFIRRASDNQFVYCLEPFVDLENNHLYNGYKDNYANILNISQEIWNKIQLIAYYGYQYGNHIEDYWYYITQVMIWREIASDAQFYFTDKLNGSNNLELFKKEIEEIENLINEHNILPNINDVYLKKGTDLLIEDTNKILNNFSVVNNNNVIINNNYIQLNNVLENQTIKLIKKSDLYVDKPILYFDSVSQKILAPGNYEPVEYDFNIFVKGSNLKINKVDNHTKSNIKKAGIEFLLYDINNNFIASAKTDENGIAIFSDLAIGKYQIKESPRQIIDGYEINTDVMVVEINDQDNLEIDFANEPVKGKIIINKYDENNLPLGKVWFGLYDENQKLLDMNETNEKGEIIFDHLVVGKYFIKELSQFEGFIPNKEEYEVELFLNKNTNKIEDKLLKVINYYEKGKVTINKTNSSNESLAGVEFNILNENMQIIYNGLTNNSGKLVINDLPLGNYFLEEVNTIRGYKPLSELIAFKIEKNAEIVTINVINEKTKIKIPDTNINIVNYCFVLPKNKKTICK